MIGHAPEFGGHDAETVGHAPPKYAPAEFITPIPKPKKQKGAAKQTSLIFDEGLSTQEQQGDRPST